MLKIIQSESAWVRTPLLSKNAIFIAPGVNQKGVIRFFYYILIVHYINLYNLLKIRNLGRVLLPLVLILLPPVVYASERPTGKNEWFVGPCLVPNPQRKLPLLA